MAISFIRVDDRMIHGQTVTRWSLEYPCTGLIAVNDAAAKNPVLKQAYKSASDKKTFVWGVDEFIAKSAKVVASKDQYFLITKNPIDMKRILVDNGFDPQVSRLSLLDRATIVQAQQSSATISRSPTTKPLLWKLSCRRVMRSSSRWSKRLRSATGRNSEDSSVITDLT